jgi:hypothetical protein
MNTMMMQGNNTTQIEDEENNKVLSERLLGNDEEEYNNLNIGDNGGYHHNHHNQNNHNNIDDEIGEIVVDSGPGGGEGNNNNNNNIGGGGPFFGQHQQNQNNNNTPQQPEYRDTPFAIAFLIHILLVFFFAVVWGFSALRQPQQDNDNNATNDDGDSNSSSVSLSGLLWLCSLTCLVSIGISAVSLQVMMNHSEILIQSSLIGSCCFMVVMIILFFIDGVITVGICWCILLLITIFYTRSVWNRIPFAAANLRTALSAIQTNGGICILAYGISCVAMIWTMIWSLALIGVSFKESSCVGGVCKPHMNIISIVFLILSFYWTTQVLQNILHVTVSGVVGTWWFDPQDALSVFSPSIVDSFRRSTTYSFGSICMGSLLVAIIQTMEAMARAARQNNTGGILLCIIECILRLISRIAVYFNRWAYCYVGLYGFDYISSGKKAMELFQARGWTTIITDNLIHRSLSLVSIVIGALSGVIGMLLAKATGWTSTIFGSSSSSSDGIVFSVCFLIGVSMAFILMSVVLSAVDTVIVAFAEAPAEFNTHHPALYNNMIEKWKLVFPDECGF